MSCIILILLILQNYVYSDLPVHCELSDVGGKWKFSLTPTSNEEPEKMKKFIPDFQKNMGSSFCLLEAPNTNSQLVELFTPRKKLLNKRGKSKSFLQYEISSLFQNFIQVNLHTDPVKSDIDNEYRLIAENLENSDFKGQWSMVFDEGFEVRIDRSPSERLSLFAFSQYECKEGASRESCHAKSAHENKDGTVDGFVSQCGNTFLGWYHVEDSSTGQIKGYGCWKGEKKVNRQQSVVAQSLAHIKKSDPNLIGDSENSGFVSDESLANPPSPNGYVVRSQEKPNYRDQNECHASSIIDSKEKGMKFFDWRREFNNEWNTPLLMQGSCGSCYSVAATYALQSRSNIMLKRKLKDSEKPHKINFVKLSPQSVLSCSYYNQACDGGYEVLASRHAREFGIPSANCEPYVSGEDGQVPSCKRECFSKENQLTFAADYGYLGGFFGECSEQRIIQSLVNHGPLTVALNVPDGNSDIIDVGDSILSTTSLSEKKSRINRSYHQSSSFMSVEDRIRHLHPDALILTLKAKSQNHINDEKLRISIQKTFSPVLIEDAPIDFVKNDGMAFDKKVSSFLESSSNHEHGAIRIWVDGQKVDREHLNIQSLIDNNNKGELLSLSLYSSMTAGVNPWEYLNHAIVVVGFGEEMIGGENVKYWLVRNSWSPVMPGGGYAKLRRGENNAAVESAATWAKPDHCRGAIRGELEKAGVSLKDCLY